MSLLACLEVLPGSATWALLLETTQPSEYSKLRGKWGGCKEENGSEVPLSVLEISYKIQL